MDDRLAKALKFAEYRETLNNQISQLKHRAEVELMYSANGGTFPITMELINFVKLLLDENKKEAALLDKNDTPILVTDLKSFYKIIFDRYNNITLDMHEQFQKIRKARKVDTVLDIDIGE
jgi:hypothetical protein